MVTITTNQVHLLTLEAKRFWTKDCTNATHEFQLLVWAEGMPEMAILTSWQQQAPMPADGFFLNLPTSGKELRH